MVAIVRALILGLVILSLVYVVVSVYSRSVRREKLEKEWDAGGVGGDRQAYVEAGMKAYAHSLRRRLIVLVYVIPAVVIAATIYWINWN